MQYFIIMWRSPLHTTADPKFECKIPALIANFCTYYAPHANHSVIYYYDATALDSNYAVNDQDFHWVVVYEFERRGWSVQDVYLGNPMRHDEKDLLINQGFSGKQRLMPYFNRQMLCKWEQSQTCLNFVECSQHS